MPKYRINEFYYNMQMGQYRTYFSEITKEGIPTFKVEKVSQDEYENQEKENGRKIAMLADLLNSYSDLYNFYAITNNESNKNYFEMDEPGISKKDIYQSGDIKNVLSTIDAELLATGIDPEYISYAKNHPGVNMLGYIEEDLSKKGIYFSVTDIYHTMAEEREQKYIAQKEEEKNIVEENVEQIEINLEAEEQNQINPEMNQRKDPDAVLLNSSEYSDFFSNYTHFFTVTQKAIFDNLPVDENGKHVITERQARFFNNIILNSLNLPLQKEAELLNSGVQPVGDIPQRSLPDYNIELANKVQQYANTNGALTFEKKALYLNEYSLAKRVQASRPAPKWYQFRYRHRLNKEANQIERMKQVLLGKGITQPELDASLLQKGEFVTAETEILKNGPEYTYQQNENSIRFEVERKRETRQEMLQNQQYLKREQFILDVKNSLVKMIEDVYNVDLEEAKKNPIVPLDATKQTQFHKEHHFFKKVYDLELEAKDDNIVQIIVHAEEQNENVIHEDNKEQLEKNEEVFNVLSEEELLDKDEDDAKSKYTNVDNEIRLDIPIVIPDDINQEDLHQTTRPWKFGSEVNIEIGDLEKYNPRRNPDRDNSIRVNNEVDMNIINTTIREDSVVDSVYANGNPIEVEDYAFKAFKELQLNGLTISNFDEYIEDKVRDVVERDYDIFTERDLGEAYDLFNRPSLDNGEKEKEFSTDSNDFKKRVNEFIEEEQPEK